MINIDFRPKGLAGGDGGPGISREEGTLDAPPWTQGGYENGAVGVALGW